MSETIPEAQLELSRVTKLVSMVRTSFAQPGSVRTEGDYFVAEEPNSFGLPSVSACPGSTEYCEQDCYAIDSERRKATAIKLQRNHDALVQAEGVDSKAELLRSMLNDYRTKADRLEIEEENRRFRIHWDGDFFSVDYAEAWKIAIEENPDIQFWAYTRSFQEDVNVVPMLAGIENLDLFMSVDIQNVDRAKEVLLDQDNVKVAYLVDYEEDAQALIDKLGRVENNRTLACPENMLNEDGGRRLPVISAKGGACARCTYCVGKTDKQWDVIFVKSGKKHREQMQFAEMPVSIRRKPVSTAEIGGLATQLSFSVDDPTLF